MKADFKDIIEAIDGNVCELRWRLQKDGVDSFNQYYALRYKYCRAMFISKFIKDKNEAHIPPNAPPSIVEYWKGCEKVLERKIAENGIVFNDINIKVKTGDLGEVDIDAIGSMKGSPVCIFKLIFGGSWRWKYATQLVKEMDVLVESKKITGEACPVAIILGGSTEPDAGNTLRIISKVGAVKRGKSDPSWDSLRKEFEDAAKVASDIIGHISKEDVLSISTCPMPSNCGFCQFHNVPLESNGKNFVCSGFVHDASDDALQ